MVGQVAAKETMAQAIVCECTPSMTVVAALTATVAVVAWSFWAAVEAVAVAVSAQASAWATATMLAKELAR